MSKNLFRKRNIGLLIKVVIAFFALWFIYREVQLKDQETDLSFGIDHLLSTNQLPYLIGLALLMLLNWTLEAYKWKTLIQHIEKISLIKSLFAIFSGITIAIFTPNRVGEYGGRIFHLQKADRIDATLLTIVGSYAQLVVTLVTGIIASIFFIPNHLGIGPLTPFQFNLIGVLMFGVAAFLVVLFLNTRLLTSIIKRSPIPERYYHYAEVFQYHSTSTLLKVFVASLSRYAVFTFQFFLLLRIFDVHVNYGEAMLMISMTYFVMTAIPTIALTELVTRGAIATKFLEMLSPNVAGIVSASSMLWLINLAIPALIGILFIFQLKFFRKPV
ncbi:lysylphosphatidylglycerol synthase domain-containing protein [Flavobacteriales bacterium]|nr:lysylphosphatidylglycerol synthase domain-containing protein [Flavobacteriales bacterium]